MAKVKIVVEVEVTGKPAEQDPEKFEFVAIKVPGQQLCHLPKDVPAPRRLAKDLAVAAGLVLTGKATAAVDPNEKKTDEAHDDEPA